MHIAPCYRISLRSPLTSLQNACAPAIRSTARAGVICACCVLALLTLAGCGKSANQYIARGNQQFAAGQYSDATLNYRNGLKKAPDSGEAYYRLGLALMKQGQGGEAYQAFNHAATLSPKNIPAKIQLANLALAIYSRDPKHPPMLYKQAESVATELMASSANRVDGLRIKGALALIDNRPGSAIEDLREASQTAPNNSEVAGGLAQAFLRDNQPDEAEKTAREIVNRDPKYVPAYQILYAIYASHQKWDEAEAVFKLWAANNPKDQTPVMRLAAFYYARKQPDDAEKVLNSMLDRRTDFPQADLLVGDFHAMVRNRAKALEDYQRGETRDKPREEIYKERVASTLATLGRRDEAMKAADALLAKDPKNRFARVLKIQLLEQIGGKQNIIDAVTQANALANDVPNDSRIQMLAGQALQMKGDLDQAALHYQKAAQASSTAAPAQMALARLELLRKNYPAVLEHSNAALAVRPNDPNARLFRIIGLTGTHSYGAAKTEAEQLAKDTKDSPQVEMQLGVIALGQGRYSEAEDLFRKLYKEGPNDLQPLAGLVNTFEAEHAPERALALMREETQRAPDSNGKEALLIATAEVAGKNDVALSELQKMAAKNPSSAEVQMRIGAIEQRNGKLPEALQAFERARQLAPDRPGIDAMIAVIQEQLGQKTEAIASYRKALAKTPEDPVVLNNLAFLLADTGGDTKEALQLVTTALRKKPDMPQLRDTLAWIQVKRHNTAEALPILESLTNKYQDNATFRYHYAVALVQSGDRAAAKRQAESALSKKPPTELASAIRTLLTQVQ